VAAVLDGGKGAAAVLAVERWPVSAAMVSAAGVLAVVGHVAPVWLGFRGGKGVATGAGVLAVLAPGALAAGVAVFALTIWATRYVSLGSCLAAVAVVGAALVGDRSMPVVIGAAATATIVLVGHRDNLARLWAGNEPRLTVGSRASVRDTGRR
jgi:glycerol-3-phosphate acyltransferase PlsY